MLNQQRVCATRLLIFTSLPQHGWPNERFHARVLPMSVHVQTSSAPNDRNLLKNRREYFFWLLTPWPTEIICLWLPLCTSDGFHKTRQMSEETSGINHPTSVFDSKEMVIFQPATGSTEVGRGQESAPMVLGPGHRMLGECFSWMISHDMASLKS